jgi:hypothetical protein
MGRKGYSRIAFMDPSKVNADEIKKPTENNSRDHF